MNAIAVRLLKTGLVQGVQLRAIATPREITNDLSDAPQQIDIMRLPAVVVGRATRPLAHILAEKRLSTGWRIHDLPR